MPGGERRRGVGIQPVVVARHRHDGRAGQPERLQRGEVGRLLGEHDVARLEQYGGDQRQRLLRAARDEELLGAGREPARGQPRGDGGAQRVVALGGRVLQRAAGVVERGRERHPHALGVEQLRRRQPAGERDHPRPLGQREDLADRRGAHVAQAGGERRRALAPGDGHRRSLSRGHASGSGQAKPQRGLGVPQERRAPSSASLAGLRRGVIRSPKRSMCSTSSPDAVSSA